MNGNKGPLDGIKVVDFGWVAVAPVTAKYLGDFGATVLRVECHRRFSIMKQSGPNRDEEGGLNRSIWWANWNSSKLSMTLDLATPRGREVGQRLVQWADVIIQGYPTRVMRDFGLDYEAARKINPKIVYAQTSQYGSYGPSSEFIGYGFVSASIAGFTDITGWPDKEAPSPPFGAYTDFVSYRFLLAAIMAALDARRRTGKGQFIDQAQVETAIHFLAPPVIDYGLSGRVIQRNGNRHPYAAPHGVYPCRGDDRWVAVAVFTDQEWQTLCGVLGHPDWTSEKRFETLSGRKAHEDALDTHLGTWTAQYTAEEVTCLMQGANVAASVVENGQDIYEDPQLNYRGMYRWLEQAEIGPIPFQGPPFKLSKTPDTQFTSPIVGEHNLYAYQELLGYSDDEIGDMIAEGVITTEVPEG